MSTTEFTVVIEDKLRQIAVKVAESLRSHPEVDGGISVRATLSFLEVLKAMDLLEGGISVQAVYDAAFSTFGSRISPKGWRLAEDILKEVLDEILFGKKPYVMRLGTQCVDEKIMWNYRNLMLDLMILSVAHEYGPPVKKEAKTGVFPMDLMSLLGDKSEESRPIFPTLTEILQKTMNQSMQNGASSSLVAVKSLLNDLEKFNLMRKDLDSNIGERYKFTKGAINLVGEKRAKEILKEHYEELVDNNSEEIWENVPREEFANLLNEIQVLLDLKSVRSQYSIKDIVHLYKDQFPTLSKVLEKLTSMTMLLPLQNLGETSSAISEALTALLEALVRERYLEDKGDVLALSPRAYELVFEDVLPEIERAFSRGEHDTLAGSGNEGEVVDIRGYHRGDRFRDIAIGATVREMAKHRRRQPEIEDIRVNQLLPRRSLGIALAIDSSRSMATYGKLFYAKKAAVGLALAAARRGDRVGVLAFSDFAKNVVDLTANVDQRFLKRVAGLRPLNSTNMEDALKKAAQTLNRHEESQKHIILVTDGVPTSCLDLFNIHTYYSGTYFRGISMKAAYAQAKRCLAQGITISAICIDRDENVDREFCRNLSNLGKGRAYFLKDERELPRTALQEYRRAKYS